LVLAILLAATLAIKTTTGRSGVFAFVASRIESRSGIRISIGSSRLSVLGGRITFEKVTVQAEGRERPFATAGEVDVKFDWSALFRSPVRLDRVVLVGGMADTAMLPQRSGKTEDDGEPPRIPLQIDDLRWDSVELASWSGGEAVAVWLETARVHGVEGVGILSDGILHVTESSGVIEAHHPDRPTIHLDVDLNGRVSLDGTIRELDVHLIGEGIEAQADLTGADPTSISAAGTLDARLGALFPDLTSTGDAHVEGKIEWTGDRLASDGNLRLTQLPAVLLEPVMQGPLADIELESKHIEAQGTYDIDLPIERTGDSEQDRESIEFVAEAKLMRGGETLLLADVQASSDGEGALPFQARWDAQLMPGRADRCVSSGTVRLSGWNRTEGGVLEDVTVSAEFADVGAAAERFGLLDRRVEALRPVGRVELDLAVSGPLAQPAIRGDLRWAHRGRPVLEVSATSTSVAGNVKLTGTVLGNEPGRREWSATVRPHPQLGWADPLLGQARATVLLPDPYGAGEQFSAIHTALMPAEPIPSWVELLLSADPALGGALSLDLDAEGPLSRPTASAFFSWRPGEDETLEIRATGTFDLTAIERSRLENLDAESRNLSFRRLAALLPSDLAARVNAGTLDAALHASGPVLHPEAHLVLHTRDLDFEGVPRTTRMSLNLSATPDAWIVNDLAAEWADPSFGVLQAGATIEPAWPVRRISASLTQLGLRGPGERATAEVEFEDGVLRVVSGSFEVASIRSGTFSGVLPLLPEYGITPLVSADGDASLTVDNIDVGSVAALWLKGDGVPEIDGTLSLTLDIDLQRVRQSRGSARLDRFRFALGEDKIESVGPLEFNLDGGELTLKPGRLLAASSAISGEAPLDLEATASLESGWRLGSAPAEILRGLRASVDGTVNASLLAPILGASGSGPVELHLTGAGRPGDFSIEGTMRGRKARFLLSDPYPTRIENFDVRVRTSGERILLEHITADINGGAGRVTGVVDPGTSLQLTGSFQGVRYRLGFGVTTRLDAEIQLEWPEEGRRRLSGDVVIHRAVMNRDINLDREILRAIFDPALDTGTSRLLETVDLDLSVLTDQGLIIRNNLAELRADWSGLEVRGTLANPRLTGVADVAPGGRLNLLGETLRIDQASLTWSSSPVDEPVISFETTSSREDPTIGQSWRSGWYTTDLGPGEGGSLGFWGATPQSSESSIGASLATYTQDRLYDSLGRVFTRTELSYEPLPLFGETDTEARFTLSQQLSNNLRFVASNNPREAEGQTYILDVAGIRSLPSLRAQVFTGDNQTEGATLQQTLILGDRDRPGTGYRYVRQRTVETPEEVHRRPLKRSVGFRKGDEFPIGAELDVEVDVAEAMRAVGYPDSRVSVVTVDAGGNLVDLVVGVEPGPRVRFVFQGTTELPRSARRRIRTVYRSGDDEERALSEMLDIAERSLRSLGCLEPVVTAEPLDTAAGEERAIRVDVACAREIDPDTPVFVGLPPDVAEFVASGFASRLARVELAAGVLEADDHLLRTLSALGYRDARISDRRLSEDGDRLELFLEPGPRSFVDEVRLENADDLTRSHARGLLAIRKGDPLRRDWIASSARALEADLRGRGYDGATVSPVVDRDADDPNQADVVFHVAAGRASTVQQVKIEGLRHSNPAWVANVANLDTDTLLRKDKIAEARGRLYRTGVFERIRVTTESIEGDTDDGETDERGGERPAPGAGEEAAPETVGLRPVAVAFEVDEAPRYRLSYGGRWESDLGLGGVVDLVNRNTLGRGHRTGLRGILNQEERSLRLYHLIPTPLRSERSTLELFVEAKREFIEDVESNVVEGWAQLTFPLSERVLTRVYGAIGERRIISGIPAAEIPLEEQVISPRFGWQLAYNTVRQGLNGQRRKGFFFGLDLSGSHASLGSDLTTYGVFTNFKIYAPFGPLDRGRFSWHQSYRAGTLTAREQPIPFVDRLRAGGEFSVRGYETNSLGPLDVDGSALGGEFMLVVNQEFHARIWDSLFGVVFFDAGNVWTTTADFDTDLFRSVGLGARYTSPVGPLRFDIGFPLDRRTSDDNYQLYFGFGSVF
jgi:translocation and assembly module TamA